MARSIIALIALSTAFLPLAVQAADYGRWTTGFAADHAYALTTNDSGEILEEDCYFNTKKCYWGLRLHTFCAQQLNSAPAIANTSTGATSLMISCAGAAGGGTNLYNYLFQDWRALESAFKDNALVGFACPLADGEFVVVRFSLDGRAQATQSMETAFTNSLPSSNSQDTSDQHL